MYLFFAPPLAGRRLHGLYKTLSRCCVALRCAVLLHLHAVFLQEEDQSALVLLTAHHLELEATTLGAMKLGAAAGVVRAFSHWYFLFSWGLISAGITAVPDGAGKFCTVGSGLPGMMLCSCRSAA